MTNDEIELPEPVGYRCSWPCWVDYYDKKDMPKEWDDAPDAIEPLFSADQYRAAIRADRDRHVRAVDTSGECVQKEAKLEHITMAQMEALAERSEFRCVLDRDLIGNPITNYDVMLRGPFAPAMLRLVNLALADQGQSAPHGESVAEVVEIEHERSGPTDEEIDTIAAMMPDGAGGMLKTWGYRQFARAVLEHLAPGGVQPRGLVVCGCGDQYPANSFGAGFMAAAGKCQNCAAGNFAAKPDGYAPFGLCEEAAKRIVAPARAVCECHRCIDENGLKGELGAPLSHSKMILCPDCGNKRCPKASDHRLACTGSNEPGQPGSVFAPPARPAVTEDLVERAAAAVFIANTGLPGVTWESESEENKELWRGSCRRVLEAALGGSHETN